MKEYGFWFYFEGAQQKGASCKREIYENINKGTEVSFFSMERGMKL